MLVSAHAENLRHADSNGNLPIHIACRYGRCDVVKWILDRSDAGVSVQNNEGKTPIQLLLCGSHVDRNSLEYVQTVNALLRAHPEALMDLCA
jgi:ankyrin repeat protein